ncbi:uncharacterized protein N7479_008778, partial [Penicillium vulpinum]|uniref:uncharacterized protein n=1 Tax=Penicillium vulpinum TaxID=29845 RepID=UPI0025493019
RENEGCVNREVRRERKKRDQRRRQNIASPHGLKAENLFCCVYNTLYRVRNTVFDNCIMGNLKQDLSHDEPCHPRAKNSFDEAKCQAQIDALYECCNAFYQERGDQASTVSCPKANLLRLKMKQRAQAAGKQ